MTGAKYTVYWQPGCTSCLRTRELLRTHAIEFESINVREHAGAMEALGAMGGCLPLPENVWDEEMPLPGGLS